MACFISWWPYSSPHWAGTQTPKAVSRGGLPAPRAYTETRMLVCAIFSPNQFKYLVSSWILQSSNTNWVAYSSIQFTELVQTPQIKEGPVRLPHSWCQPQKGLPGYLYFGPANYKSGIPTRPFIHGNLLGWLIDFGNCFSYIYWWLRG